MCISTIVQDSERSSRDVIRFMHYADYNLQFIPDIHKECTHAWALFAALTIDPVTLSECITGKKVRDRVVADSHAIATVALSDEP